MKVLGTVLGVVASNDGRLSIGDESVTLAQLQGVVGGLTPRTLTPNEVQAGALMVFTTVALTAARTLALPSAASLAPGTTVRIYDIARGATSSNTITATLNGSDTYNGGSTSPLLNAAGGKISIITDGVSRWTDS